MKTIITLILATAVITLAGCATKKACNPCGKTVVVCKK